MESVETESLTATSLSQAGRLRSHQTTRVNASERHYMLPEEPTRRFAVSGTDDKSYIQVMANHIFKYRKWNLLHYLAANMQ